MSTKTRIPHHDGRGTEQPRPLRACSCRSLHEAEGGAHATTWHHVAPRHGTLQASVLGRTGAVVLSDIVVVVHSRGSVVHGLLLRLLLSLVTTTAAVITTARLIDRMVHGRAQRRIPLNAHERQNFALLLLSMPLQVFPYGCQTHKMFTPSRVGGKNSSRQVAASRPTFATGSS